MQEKIKQLKTKKIVITPQRLAVLGCFKDKNYHPTAEEIYNQLRAKYPTLSLATVYTALEVLKKAGEIQELNLQKGVSRYDWDFKPHHHFFCQNCRQFFNLEISCPLAEKGEINGYQIQAVQACFYGFCPDCLTKG